jgi:UDP-N-acetylglucosamine 2-epimerase
VESIAQGVAQRVIDLVVESLDLNALIAQIDLNAVLARVDLNEVVAHIDLDEVVARVDMNKLLARVDINQIVSRIDVETLVKNTDLGAIMVSSSSTLATEAVDLGRGHAVSMDDTLGRWASRIRRNHRGRAEPPELPNTPEEP